MRIPVCFHISKFLSMSVGYCMASFSDSRESSCESANPLGVIKGFLLTHIQYSALIEIEIKLQKYYDTFAG